MSKKVKKMYQPVEQQQGVGTMVAGGLAMGAGGSLMNAGGSSLITCPPGDESFYCKFVKGFNVFKMILFILVIVIIVGFLIWLFTKKN